MEVVSIAHNERTKILIKTKKADYLVSLAQGVNNEMTGFFLVHLLADNSIYAPGSKCICEGDIEPELFYPTDEKAIKLIEDKVLEFIESYELNNL